MALDSGRALQRRSAANDNDAAAQPPEQCRTEREETLLPSGIRLVVEGRGLAPGGALAQVDRVRLVAGGRILYES